MISKACTSLSFASFLAIVVLFFLSHERIAATSVASSEYSWGVLVFNADKDIFAPNETAKVALSVLDPEGDMICNAKLTLKIEGPSGFSVVKKTGKDGGIIVNYRDCRRKGFSPNPDYESEIVLGSEGEYTATLTANTTFGERVIQQTWLVSAENPLFSIQRKGPTRTYPTERYRMEITVTPREDFSGTIMERFPTTFVIHGMTPQGSVQVQAPLEGSEIKHTSPTTLFWNVEWEGGKTYTLLYDFQPFGESPFEFKIDPLQFEQALSSSERSETERVEKLSDEGTGDGHFYYLEKRSWHIANDLVSGNLFPVADGNTDSASWADQDSDACNSTGCYLNVDETSGGTTSCTPNTDGDTSWIETDTNDDIQSFNIDTSFIGAGGSITDMAITACANEQGNGQGATIEFSYCVGASCNTFNSNLDITGTYADYTQTFTSLSLDPTGDIEIGVERDSGGRALRVTRMLVVITYDPPPISVTGTLYSDEGTTPLASKKVSISVDGGAAFASDVTDAGGQFTIASTGANTLGAVLTLYVDGETERAVTVTVSSGSIMTGVTMYRDRLIVKFETGAQVGGTITNDQIEDADDNGDTDITDIFTSSSSGVVVKNDKELLIWQDVTYAPGGSVKVGSGIDINGTFDLAGNPATLSGSWDATGGSFTGTTAIVTFDATSGTIDIIQNGFPFRSVEFGGDGGSATWLPSASLNVSGSLTIADGILNLNGNNLIIDGAFSNDATLRQIGSETVTLSADQDSGTWEYVGDADALADSFTVTDYGSATDYFNLSLIPTDGALDTFQIVSSFSGAGTFTLSGTTFNQNTHGFSVESYTQSGGTFIGGTGEIFVDQHAAISDGIMTTTSGGTTTVNTLYIGNAGIVRIATGGKLLIEGSGTPLTGSGTLDTHTYTPNTVEYTGPGVTDISIATPVQSYYSLTLDPPAFVEDDLLTFVGGEANLTSAVIDTGGGFAYFGTNTNPGQIIKVRLSDFTRVGNLTLNDGEGGLRDAVLYNSGGFLLGYFIADTNPSKVIKVDLQSFTRVGAVTFGTGGVFRSLGLDPIRGFAYAGQNSNTAEIVKLDIHPERTFAYDSVIALNAGEDSMTTVVVDAVNGNAYFTGGHGGVQDREIVRVNINHPTFARSTNLTITGNNAIEDGVIDVENGIAYFGTGDSPANILEITLSSFTHTATASLTPAAENAVKTGVIDTVNGFTYWGMPGRVTSVDNSPFARDDGIIVSVSSPTYQSSVIDVDNGFAYFGSDASPGGIVKVQLSPLLEDNYLFLEGGHDVIRAIAIDRTNGFLYAATKQGTGEILKIRTSDFAHVGTLTLPAGEQSFTEAIIDEADGFAYFGTDDSPAEVIKIDLSDFTRDSALTLDSGDNSISASAIDPANDFGYFGLITSPGQVVRVNLATMAKSGTDITFAAGENTVGALAIDLKRAFLYGASVQAQSRIRKIDLSDFSLVGATVTLNSGEDNVGTGVADEKNGFTYWGTTTPLPTEIIKVDVNDPTFSRVGAIDMTGIGRFKASVIDEKSGFAYFGSDNTGVDRVVKIDLTNFTRIDTLVFSAPQGGFDGAVIDGTGGYMYFASNESPGRITKIITQSRSMRIGTNTSQTLTATGNLTIGNGDGADPALVTAAKYDPTIDILGNFFLNASGATLTGSSTSDFSVAGNWVSSGSFFHNGGTVTLDGGNQTMSGSNTFFNLTKIVSSPQTFTLAATAQQIIANALTLRGAVSNLLSLRSTITNLAAKMQLTTGKTQTIDFLNVQDNDASGGEELDCLTASEECVDSGNTTNWNFGAGPGPAPGPAANSGWGIMWFPMFGL